MFECHAEELRSVAERSNERILSWRELLKAGACHSNVNPMHSNFEDCGLPGKLSCHRFVGWCTRSDADGRVCYSGSKLGHG